MIGKPRNKWGWLRIAGWAAAAILVIWTVLAAGLRGLEEAAWIAWSGYQSFSLLRGIELLVVPLLAIFLGGWLEEHDHRTATEQSDLKEAERAVTEQRGRIVRHFQEAVQVELAAMKVEAAQLMPHARKIVEETRAALPELDGKGRGELLSFLYKQELLAGDTPLVDLGGLDFSGATFDKAQLERICLDYVHLDRAQLNEARLVKARFSKATLKKAFLRQADLRDAVLAGSNLTGAHLEGANLEGADLKVACLESVFLIHANLKNCVLSGLQVKDANFQNADLSGAKGMRLESLDEAILVDTILPDGRKVTNEKGKSYLHEKEMAIVIDRL